MTHGVAGRFDDAHVHLRLLGEEREVSFPVRVDRCTVKELLAPAREISAQATSVALAQAEAAGERVQCGPACAACCRQLVPVSVIEAVRLAELVANMPPERRAVVVARFAEAVRTMEERGLLDPGMPRGRHALLTSAPPGVSAWEDVSRRYFAAGVPCPFLESESCSIYAERPLVCREYNVTTPPERCASLDGGARATARPIRMSEALGRVAAERLGLPAGTVPLTLALEWSEIHQGALCAEHDGEALFWALMRQVDEQSEQPFDRR